MMKPVHITAKDPPIDIFIPMGDGPALPVGGLGGYELVARQDDVAATTWEGQDPLAEDVPLLLDGHSEQRSVQREWNTVKKLARDPNGERRPPVFRVWGPIDSPEGKAWVLPADGISIDSESIIKEDDGDLRRIEFTLHLLEYIAPDEIRLRGKKQRSAIADNRALTYITREGDTLATIAYRLFGDWKRWKEIGKKNDIHDPNRVLPKGRELRL